MGMDTAKYHLIFILQGMHVAKVPSHIYFTGGCISQRCHLIFILEGVDTAKVPFHI